MPIGGRWTTCDKFVILQIYGGFVTPCYIVACTLICFKGKHCDYSFWDIICLVLPMLKSIHKGQQTYVVVLFCILVSVKNDQ